MFEGEEPVAMNDHRSKADPWRCGTWEGSREARLDAVLAVTPAQRIAWLEDALHLAFRATRRSRPPVAGRLAGRRGQAACQGLPPTGEETRRQRSGAAT